MTSETPTRPPAPITCRQCGSSTATHDPFYAVETGKVHHSFEAIYRTDGSWDFQPMEANTGHIYRQIEIQCMTCAHAWTTSRSVPGVR